MITVQVTQDFTYIKISQPKDSGEIALSAHYEHIHYKKGDLISFGDRLEYLHVQEISNNSLRIV